MNARRGEEKKGKAQERMSRNKKAPKVEYGKATKAIIDRVVGNLSSVLDGRGMKEEDYPTANAQCLVMDKRLITDALELIKDMQSSIQQLGGQSTINSVGIAMDDRRNIHAFGNTEDLVCLCCRVLLMMHDGTHDLPKLPKEMFIFFSANIMLYNGEENVDDMILKAEMEYEEKYKNNGRDMV